MKSAWVAAALGIALILALWLMRGDDEDVAAPRDATAAIAPTIATHASLKDRAITGRVTRASDGGPLAASVSIHGGTSTEVIATAADGTWSAAVADGEYTLAAMAEGFVPAIREHVVPGAHVELALRAGGYALSGIVTDIGGGPIGGAQVSVQLDAGVIAAVTRLDGRYRIHLPAGVYNVDASEDDYADQTRRAVLADAPERLDFALVPGVQIRGIVRARDGGAPIADAVVQAFGKRGNTYGEASAISGPDGRFVIRGLNPGVNSVEASARGYATNGRLELELGAGEHADEVVLYVDRAYTIAGRVVLAKAPVAHARVNVTLVRNDNEGSSSRIETDASGAFELVGLHPGRYRVGASLDGAYGERADVVIADRDVANVEVALEAVTHVTIAGRVEPPVAATIELDDRSTRTDATGHFTFAAVTPGKRSLFALADDHRLASVPLVVGQLDQTVVLTLQLGASVRGTVIDDASKPVAGARVEASVSPADHRFWTTTDDHGAFALGNLPATNLVLKAYDHTPRADDHDPAMAIVDLSTANHRDDVSLIVRARSGELRGVVHDATGAPVVDAWVSAVAYGDSHEPVATGADGTFRFTGLHAARYRVEAFGPRGESYASLQTVPKPEPITLELAPIGSLVVRVTAGGAPVTTFDLDCRMGNTRHVISPDGTVTLTHLTPRTYRCSVAADQGVADGEVKVDAGTATLALDLPLDVSVSGLAVNALTGAPIADATVRLRTTTNEEVRTDHRGYFELHQVPAAGRLYFSVRDQDLGDVEFAVRPGQRLDLGTVPLAPVRTGPRGTLGFSGYRSDTRVRDVVDPATTAGLRNGDTVTAVDGVALAPRVFWAVIYEGIAAGQVVKLTLERGDTISITAVPD